MIKIVSMFNFVLLDYGLLIVNIYKKLRASNHSTVTLAYP